MIQLINQKGHVRCWSNSALAVSQSFTRFNWTSVKTKSYLTLSWQRPISCRNQSIDLLRKSVDWFLYDIGLSHERVKIYSWEICASHHFPIVCGYSIWWNQFGITSSDHEKIYVIWVAEKSIMLTVLYSTIWMLHNKLN